MAQAGVLFSGGLDSMLAVRILQSQGVSVHALNVRTVYQCCRGDAAQAADALGISFTALAVGDDYLDLIRRPRFGRGKGVNPCVDCRVYMGKLAKRLMQDLGADLVATGEVLGQRPMSQKRRDLDVIAHHSGLEGRLLRPLSATLLPPTIPECQGIVDRRQLFGFVGSSRKPLVELARRLDVPGCPTPSNGCALAEPGFAVRVQELLRAEPQAARWDFELLRYGRHTRLASGAKIVLGRNQPENANLASMAARDDAPRRALLTPEGFQGSTALVVGECDEDILCRAGRLIAARSRLANQVAVRVQVDDGQESRLLSVPLAHDALPAACHDSH